MREGVSLGEGGGCRWVREAVSLGKGGGVAG